MKIAIKKISSKASVQPINVPTITAQVIESTLRINRSTNDEQQDRFELQAMQSHSQIINVAPLHLEEQRAESLENIDMIQVNLCQKLFFFAEHGENMLCTKIVLNVRNNFCTQHVLPRFEHGIFMY